jgi:hypothetical protein
LNGIQEVASSILVSSTTERTIFPLTFDHRDRPSFPASLTLIPA